ncbi:unnamed protein product [Coregonus sp. 'balchen']|nr:unnamed protein product [Coregonus sp. 'balchen']
MAKAKFWLYRDIFTQQNITFGQPRTDTCSKCDRFSTKLSSVATEEERTKVLAEIELHHRKAEEAYSQLQNNTEWVKANMSSINIRTLPCANQREEEELTPVPHSQSDTGSLWGEEEEE